MSNRPANAATALLAKQPFCRLDDLSLLQVENLLLPDNIVISSYRAYAAAVGLPASSFSGTEGITLRHGGKYVILYDDAVKSPKRRNFTLAHELGHLYLAHSGEAEEREEKEANLFAAALLAPMAVIDYLQAKLGRPLTLDDMCLCFPLSRDAAERRLRELPAHRRAPLSQDEMTLLLHLFAKDTTLPLA